MSRLALVRVLVPALALLALSAPRVRAGDVLPVHAGTRVLRSGSLVVEIADPEPGQYRWNKGTRFSGVANILRVQLRGQEFVYSPVSGGALQFLGGLPMEFDIGQEAFQPDPPGYNEGKNGDPFLKIGVGILRRDSGAYDFGKNYTVVEWAYIRAAWQADRVHFVQTLSGSANGYSCHLEEDVILRNDRLVLKYLLRNTGTKRFTTEQYLHNFICFNGRTVGPNTRLSFPYDFTTSPAVTPWQPPPKGRILAIASAATVVRIANMIEYMEKATSVPKIWVYKPQGYAGPDRFTVAQAETQQRLTIESSIPAAYVGIWTTDYQVSPEQFLQITLAPGEEARFTRTYVFHVDGFVPQDSTGDGVVDVNDLGLLSAAWLRKPDAADWAAACDISLPADDRIDLRDFTSLAHLWRQENGLPAPLAHWKLDETTGTSACDERGLHPAVLHNFAGDDTQWTPGQSGGGLQFDGADDYVEVAGDLVGAGFKPARPVGSPCTISAWLRLNEKPLANQAILAWGEPTAGKYWLLEVDASRRLKFSCGAGYAFASRLVGDTQWHHIAVTLDPLVPDDPHVSDIRLYVDTRPQVVYEMAEASVDTGETAALRIGASFDPNESGHFNGILDDVRVYDTALDASQIRHVYRAAIPEQSSL